QSLVPEGYGTDDGRGDREVSRLRHDPRHWTGLREEAGARIRRGSVRRDRTGTASPAPGHRHRPKAGGADHCGLGRAEGHPRDLLHSNGVSTSRAVRIYKTYGVDAVQLISENPYRLARDIRGIGFRTADQIAAKLGIEKTELIRVRAGICCALAEAMDDGHCGLPADELVALTQELLEVCRRSWSKRHSASNFREAR